MGGSWVIPSVPSLTDRSVYGLVFKVSYKRLPLSKNLRSIIDVLLLSSLSNFPFSTLILIGELESAGAA